MNYQVLSAVSLTQLEKAVNVELAHGWLVTGGLITYTLPPERMLEPPSQFFAQAMIRQKKEPPSYAQK